MRRSVSWIMLALLAMVTFILALNVGLVRAQAPETVTINSDGSVSPSSAPISTVDNVTYTFTGNMSYPVYNGIVVERSNTVIDGNGYTVQGNNSDVLGLNLSDISNVTVKNVNVKGFSTGILLRNSSNNIVNGNTATANNIGGIGFESSSNNTVSGNNATSNIGDGILLDSSNNNTVSGNNATANIDNGILLSSSNNNTVIGNTASTNSQYGIWLYSSSNNTVSGNNVTANSVDGIVLNSANNNEIYHNNFVNNTLQVMDNFNSTNVWDNGYPSGGNYWSDYQTKYPNAVENDSSGIWNTPYVIDANNTDYYPLMNQVAIVPEFQLFLLLPLFMIVTLLAVAIYRKKLSKT